ncbi:RagB/SusD family nutrient uptake outer membrane protein [Sphingobacterium sp. SGR-19]|uniref:RagB/SusD family nutrient uptake outer membrane protein n=1 Tax=Sphingobacterium sp. SGR-19 TaxID=2710886 RepID=UPI0013E9E91A|nr:RagB/SusD family nutrient uptake outer membrane protein [Sphingobacterium sp. SGR-19]NGM65138.1 RagB/SusD family nutrient uptake outer membrane protein [Sphingobacterium sp. SGR-19]
MKKLLLIIWSLQLIVVGCSTDDLHTDPTGFYTDENFWTSEKGATAALSGCYATLRSAGLFGGDAVPLLEDTATPNAYNYDNSGGFSVIANGTQTANNSAIINNRWRACYEGIGRANTFLDNVGRVPMNEDIRNRMIAEAKFLRALYYSILQMYYGGVPLILETPKLDHASLPRNPRAEIVAQVLKDLEEAVDGLPTTYTGGDIGRATKGAALALKARVLLFEASPLNNPNNAADKWEAVVTATESVMNLSEAGYNLLSNYRQVFMPENDNSAESVFAVQFKAPEQGSSFDLIGRQYNTNAPIRGLIDAYYMKDGRLPSESTLYDPALPYKDRDPRMYQTVVYPGDTYMGSVTTPTEPFKITGYGVKKYTIYDKEPNTNIINGGRSETNYMLIRYADVLLMYAEAKNEVLDAPDESVYATIERIRQRAGLDPYALPRDLNKSQMRDLIRHERRIELALEGFYYTDIRRWKMAETVLNSTIYNAMEQPLVTRRFNPQRDYWWPIPDRERELNPNLEQNANY